MSRVDNAFYAWANWAIVFVDELDDERDVSQSLVVLNSEDKRQRHRRVHGRNGSNINGVPGAPMDIELSALNPD
jgi:hypothetical protein